MTSKWQENLGHEESDIIDDVARKSMSDIVAIIQRDSELLIKALNKPVNPSGYTALVITAILRGLRDMGDTLTDEESIKDHQELWSTVMNALTAETPQKE